MKYIGVPALAMSHCQPAVGFACPNVPETGHDQSTAAVVIRKLERTPLSGKRG
jgi:hypothetical protein